MSEHGEERQPCFRFDYDRVAPEFDPLSANGWKAFKAEVIDRILEKGPEHRPLADAIIRAVEQSNQSRIDETIADMEAKWE